MELTLSRLRLPVHAWINDALMAIFFFLVGMEIKHEIVHGELADMRRAALPIFGALGGMIVPALLYMALNVGLAGQHGWGVPMATDIAFSLGVLGMVKGVPQDLKIFLLTLAIADDIGAIAVIAVFYTDSLNPQSLFVGLILLALIFVLRKVGISQPVLYFVLGVGFGRGTGIHGSHNRDLVVARVSGARYWNRGEVPASTGPRRRENGEKFAWLHRAIGARHGIAVRAFDPQIE
jgi:NhaA family Na+:H+ antiporter